jgi:rubrerythrin
LSRCGAGLGAGVIVLAGCSSRSQKAEVQALPAAAQNLDVAVLNRSLDLEYEAIAAYTAGIPLLGGRPKEAAKRFLNQELSHSGELAGLVKQAGGKPHKPKPMYNLGQPRDDRGVLSLLHEIEQRELRLYLQAVTQVSPGSVRAAVAAMLANDAQHLAILRSSLKLDPIPSAFVTGAA